MIKSLINKMGEAIKSFKFYLNFKMNSTIDRKPVKKVWETSLCQNQTHSIPKDDPLHFLFI